MSALRSTKLLARGATASGRSLLEDISRLRHTLVRVKDELRMARGEIKRLELLLENDRPTASRDLHLADLRRKVSFYCHPDRGGDVALMQRLNALFDQLEQ